MRPTVPSVSVSSITGTRWNVVIYRKGDLTTFEVGDRLKAEALAAEIRGALADAFHAGAHEEAASRVG